MKRLQLPLFLLLVLSSFYFQVLANPRVGFFLPDSIQEMSMKFRSIKNLIILPVIINDSIKVNLILDTGCRNLVLFGKRFQKLLTVNQDRPVQFSGLGSGNPVNGYLSLNNHVSIQSIVGEKIPVVVVPSKNLFALYNEVHGIIGYDIFLKFEIEINSREHLLTFRPAMTATPRSGYSEVPLQIVDSRPILHSNLELNPKSKQICDLMIDTGSTLGLLLKTTDIKKFNGGMKEGVIGRGLNGILNGFETTTNKLILNGFEMNDLPTGIVHSDWHNHASIGMEILKDYVVVLNYCKSYACLKRFS